MPRQAPDQQESQERRPLLSPAGQSTNDASSFRDVETTDISDSVEALRPVDSSHAVHLTKLRAAGIIASLGVLIFIQASNISLLTTTQGVIAADFDAFEDVSWFTSAYLVAMASTSPLTGKLSYILTPRVCMFISTIVLALGSVITGCAPTLAVFLAGRAISGTGAAGILSVATILVVDLTTPKQRGLYTGILNTGFTIGVAAGAVAAGAIEPVLGWRSLFYLQCPISLLAGVCLMLSIPASFSVDEPSSKADSKPLINRLADVDYLGAILLVLTIVSLLYGLSPPSIRPLALVLSVLFLPLFLFQELYGHHDPIIPLSVLASRGVLLTCLGTLGFMMSRWAVLFYTPVHATAALGWPPAAAGAILLPTNAGFAAGGLAAGALHIRRPGGWYTACLVVYGIFAVSLAVLAMTTRTPLEAPAWPLMASAAANGAAAGAALNYALHHAMHLVRRDARFVAAALIAAFRGFAGTFGSAGGGAVFARVLRRRLLDGFASRGVRPRPDLVRRLLGSPRTVRELVGVEHEVAVEAYAVAVRILFAAAAALAVVVFFVQAGTGWTSPEEREAVEDHNESDNDEEEDRL